MHASVQPPLDESALGWLWRSLALAFGANENEISHRWRGRALIAINVFSLSKERLYGGQRLAASFG